MLETLNLNKSKIKTISSQVYNSRKVQRLSFMEYTQVSGSAEANLIKKLILN
uniref:Uncharacterized protein n=1 Tax=CrAss-like virus sp. ctYsL76 TaxID=2826826 RepID=A0A8S5QMU5_9CAUD|nr:MAG TPA: hypothetical protein [CrAss-like virus sp. ctYsL76]